MQGFKRPSRMFTTLLIGVTMAAIAATNVVHNMKNHITPEQKQGFWNAQQDPYEKLKQLEKLPAVAIFPNLSQAFHDPDTLICIDERGVGAFENPVAIAGCGILLTSKEKEIVARKAGDRIRHIGYHDQCGACALYCKLHNDAREPLAVGEEAAKEMIEYLHLHERPIFVGFDEAADVKMEGHPEFHHARAIYVDGSGRFNPAKLGLPDGFLLSAYWEPSLAYTRQELGIALGIAMGDHGFSEEFEREPLIVVLIGHPSDSEYSRAQMKKELAPALEGYKYVRVVGFTAPRS